MKRRGFLQAIAAAVAGLFVPKAVRADGNSTNLANAVPQPWPEFDEERLEALRRHIRERHNRLLAKRYPAPAPGQVWEQRGRAFPSRWFIAEENVMYQAPEEIRWRVYKWPFASREPDPPYPLNVRDSVLRHWALGWRYLGHITDLAALVRCTPYEPVMRPYPYPLAKPQGEWWSGSKFKEMDKH